jgi:hypothetical protein
MEAALNNMSRRSFILAGSAALATAQSMPSPLTAGEIVDRIRKQVGIP